MHYQGLQALSPYSIITLAVSEQTADTLGRHCGGGVGCLTSQQHVCVSQGAICSDNVGDVTLRKKLQINHLPHPVTTVVCWLLNVPTTGLCISGTDLLRQLYVLPHTEIEVAESNFLPHPFTVVVGCWLLNVPSNRFVYLRDRSAQTM